MGGQRARVDLRQVRAEGEAAVSVDRAALRKLVEGWKPGMTVEIRVDVLTALLDDLDEIDRLGHELQRLRFQGQRLERLASHMEDEPEEDPCS